MSTVDSSEYHERLGAELARREWEGERSALLNRVERAERHYETMKRSWETARPVFHSRLDAFLKEVAPHHSPLWREQWADSLFVECLKSGEDRTRGER